MLTLLLLSLYIQVSMAEDSFIMVKNGGPRGVWSSTRVCPEGSIATGFQLTVEGYNFLTDNTAMTAIKIFCSKVSSVYIEAVISSGFGTFGTPGKEFMCDPGTYIHAFSLRVGGSVIDYMGATNIMVVCSNGKILEGDGSDWGEWGECSEYCTYGVNGITSKNEEYQGVWTPDSGVNDVKLLCRNSPLLL